MNGEILLVWLPLRWLRYRREIHAIVLRWQIKSMLLYVAPALNLNQKLLLKMVLKCQKISILAECNRGGWHYFFGYLVRICFEQVTPQERHFRNLKFSTITLCYFDIFHCLCIMSTWNQKCRRIEQRLNLIASISKDILRLIRVKKT